jgi:peptide/nickel transport system ATP-binding protein
MVFQDPHGSLNPRHTIAQSLALPLTRLCSVARRHREARIGELLDLVALPRRLAASHPHELSGGQCQRVAIARARAPGPEILILEESLSALDVSIQAQILSLLEELRARLGLSCLFISHDLAVVERFYDDTVVMRAGRVVEQGPCRRMLAQPAQRYMRLLLQTALATSGQRRSPTGPGWATSDIMRS